jgi:hypothetical protein
MFLMPMQVLYLCFILWRLITHREITKRARVALFSRRLAGLLISMVLMSMFWFQYGLIVFLILTWGPIALCEWWALQYALERNLPGVTAKRLPLY